MSNQSNNDKLIKDLSKVAAKKLTELGKKPNQKYCTDMEYIPRTGQTILNLNVCDLSTCIEIYREMLTIDFFNKKISKDIGIDMDSLQGFPLATWKRDVRIRIKTIQWIEKKNLIKKLDKQLSDLRSEGARTSDAIDDIAKLLNQ